MTDASTTSRPLFNRQQLISLFLPLVAEQALSISIGLADTLMVSSVGEAAVSGVSLVDSFNVLMIQLLSALATGGAVVASQYIGHREPKRAKASAANAVAGNISSFLNVPASAVGIGALTVVGQCLGAGEKAQAKRYSRLLLPDGAQVPLRPAVHLAGHVPGLGHALAVLLRPLCPRQVDGTKGDLNVRVFIFSCRINMRRLFCLY